MDKLPRHIAIVMDGNGRWASQRKMPRFAGHHAGSKVVKKIVEYCARQPGIEVLSLFAFSLENRRRPATEVQYLMRLLLESLQRNTAQLHQNNVCLHIIGDRRYFDVALRRQVEAAEDLTKNNSGLKLIIAINYSGRWDIAQAAQKLVLDHMVSEKVPELDNIEGQLEQHLSTAGFPAPDLLIRTSGEQRISNFMLWQLAYTELVFVDEHWPDFNETTLENAIEFYQTRQRRFGLTPEQAVAKYAEA